MGELRERSVRSRSWQPITKYGIIHTDRKYVIIFTLACFTIPFIFEWSVYRIPLPLPMALIGLALSVAFFKFIRLGRRPHWFANRVRAITEDIRYLFCRDIRRALPRDEEQRGSKPWVEGASEEELLTFLHTGQIPY